MTALQIYVSFPGTAREALGFYADVFGGELSLFTYEEFSRSDGPPTPLPRKLNGAVALAGSDAAAGTSVRFEGLMLSLLGTAEPAVLHEWFGKLAVGGRVVDPLRLGARTATSLTGTDFTGSSATSPSPERRTSSLNAEGRLRCHGPAFGVLQACQQA